MYDNGDSSDLAYSQVHASLESQLHLGIQSTTYLAFAIINRYDDTSKRVTTHNTHSTHVNCILTNSTYLENEKKEEVEEEEEEEEEAIYNFMEFYYSFTPKKK